MNYNEFRATTLKLKGKKNFKITNSYGTKEAWRWLKKNKWLNIGQPITEHDFGVIIKSINLFLQDQLLQGHDIDLPMNMGRIELRKFKTHIKVGQEGIKTNMVVDWKKTLELWNEDIEAKNSKTLVRIEAKEIFKFYYNRKRAKYTNKTFYEFTPTRSLKKRLSDKIKNNEIDAFLINKDEIY